MDQELEALRHALRASPGDVLAAVRLAVALERTGRAREAWDALLPLAEAPRPGSGAGDELSPSVRTARAALAGLAAREPSAVHAHLVARAAPLGSDPTILSLSYVLRPDAPPRVLLDELDLSVRVLAEEGELAVPVALALGGESILGSLAEVALTWVVRAILGVDPLPAEMLRALASGAGPTDLAASDGISADVDVVTLAFELTRAARAPGGQVLLPWVAALLETPREAVAEEARAAFRELTGLEAPPVDAAALARRWHARASGGASPILPG